MKRLLALIFMMSCICTAQAQLNNEWIDYSKTYYKFKVGKTGLQRIPYAVLQQVGLATIPMEHFQLFRNGVEVPIYTSRNAGMAGTADYIEFYGKQNDGQPEARLYRQAGWQINASVSMLTDTATYFLTVNSTGLTARIRNEVNLVSANTLAPEPFFMHTYVRSFRDRLNEGNAFVSSGVYIFSSSYDQGEGWTSRDIYPGSPINETYALFPAQTGGNVQVAITYSGNAPNNRNVELAINGKPVFDEVLNGFALNSQSYALPLNSIGRQGGDAFFIRNKSANGNDRIVVGELKITYPRQFNFDGSKAFEFTLPSSTSGNYLEITHFSHGNSQPILFDITNRLRYTGMVENGVVKFLLKPSQTVRSLVLLSTEAAAVVEIKSMEERRFTDYSKAVHQGNYVILSNKQLFSGPSGNPVENYRSYRASAAGGGFNAKVYDVEEIVDQFGFGIRWNPIAIKHFIQYARNFFQVKPSYILIIGRGILYNDARRMETLPITHQMNLVPTWGSPGSDNLMGSPGYDVSLDIPIGRIAAVNGHEVEVYLQKIKQHESGKASAASSMKERAWRKNIVHAIGGTDPFLQSILTQYMRSYEKIAEDTALGANVHTFSKAVNVNADLLTSEQLAKLFEEGISMLTFFGHSATEILEFNIDEPETYNNPGKYPFFMVNGCYAGNIFIYDTLRIRGKGLTLSEKYNMAKERGSIGFLAHSHVGIVNYLSVYTDGFYHSLGKDQYGKGFGDVHRAALATFNNKLSATDFLGRTHLEQLVLHADPAVATGSYIQPDYVIEDPMVKISPNPVSVLDKEFKLQIKYANLGKATMDSIRVLVQRRLQDGSIKDLFNRKVLAPKFEDSIILLIPINPILEKGQNQVLITLDADQKVTEQSEMNNLIRKDFTILEDEIRPVFPLNYSIVNQPVNEFFGSVANPYTPLRTYQLEIDTTALFNSNAKVTSSIQTRGSIVRFANAPISWKDSTVYYWRTAPMVSGTQPNWSTASFLYLKNNPVGFAQAHFFQHQKSDFNKIRLDADRAFTFDTSTRKFSVRTGIFPFYTGNKFLATLDEVLVANWGCRLNSLQIIVLDAKTLKPWANTRQSNGLGSYGSWPPCDHNITAFEFPYQDPTYRRNAVRFLESLPDGVVISVSNFARSENTSFITEWMNDTASMGKNQSLYHALVKLGFVDINKFTRNLPFLFVTRKNGNVIHQQVGESETAYIDESFYLTAFSTAGTLRSPWFGPATGWSRLKWKGKDLHPSTDIFDVDVFGKDKNGQEEFLFRTKNIDTSLMLVDAKKYPYLQLQLRMQDSLNASPYQLSYWMLTGQFPPEGAISTENIFNAKDTVEVGEVYPFEMAFRNISTTSFDSIKVKLMITNSSNVTTEIPLPKLKPLSEGDTVVVRHLIDTRKLSKENIVLVNFNPDGIQPEQHLFNNFLYKSFFVKADEYKPVLDVTFDGVRILNEDIVSAKPHIRIKLTDNNKYLMLDDTSLMTLKVRYPDNQIRTFRFNTDTVRFTPAVFSNGVKENAATIDFLPIFQEDGMYELIVTGSDKSGNSSSFIEYNVAFNILNKPMISNLLNYPNPFTTSTAFVFTLTGAQVPQNMRIQILTVTGKIVREITKDALGPIRIGRNITEYKWDGTDEFGQKLANGVYLYRVITNLNGRSIDNLPSGTGGYRFSGEEKYFTNGYGKMYLMR